MSALLACIVAAPFLALMLAAAIGRADHGEDTDDDWGAL